MTAKEGRTNTVIPMSTGWSDFQTMDHSHSYGSHFFFFLCIDLNIEVQSYNISATFTLHYKLSFVVKYGMNQFFILKLKWVYTGSHDKNDQTEIRNESLQKQKLHKRLEHFSI